MGSIEWCPSQINQKCNDWLWNGGDNPDIDYDKMAYLPEISFDVKSNDEYEESVSRSAGLLKALGINVYKPTTAMPDGAAQFATTHKDIATKYKYWSISINKSYEKAKCSGRSRSASKG